MLTSLLSFPGQDPYPRAESAIGVAFNDGQIHNVRSKPRRRSGHFGNFCDRPACPSSVTLPCSYPHAHTDRFPFYPLCLLPCSIVASLQWTDKFSPSFANIVKNLLYGKGLVTVDQGVADVRKTLAREGIVAPPAWFEHTIKSGVCWLNTSLTFTSTDTTILAQHLKFWKPIVEAILTALIAAKRDLKASGNPNAGLVFVLWGGHAVKLKKMVETLNKSSGDPIDLIFIEAPHPAANGNTFHTVKTFEAVDAALAKLGLPSIDWLPKGAPGSVAPVEAKKPAKKVTAPKKAAVVEKVTVVATIVETEAPAPSGRPKRSVAKRPVVEMDFSDDESLSEYDSEEEKPKKRKAATKKASAKTSAAADSDDEDAPKPKRAKRT